MIGLWSYIDTKNRNIKHTCAPKPKSTNKSPPPEFPFTSIVGLGPKGSKASEEFCWMVPLSAGVDSPKSRRASNVLEDILNNINKKFIKNTKIIFMFSLLSLEFI